MTPEATRYLEKARLILENERLMLTVNLTEDAGRSAYLAGYQAAEARYARKLAKSPEALTPEERLWAH